MQFHCLMIARDEDDIIGQCLAHLLTWADAIYVIDLGSTDGTWDIVQEAARRDRRVVPFRSEPFIFHESLRAMLFDQYRDRFKPGDWILRTDADEFYQIPPTDFVRQRVALLETAVLLQWYYFRLTSVEVADYESGRINLMADRQRPIEHRRTMYKIPQYSEPRMFRYRRTMSWPTLANIPFNIGYVARERIPILHYPHRDPLQMSKRFRLRAAMMKLKGSSAGSHWKLDDWRKEVLQVDPITGQATELTNSDEGLSAAPGHTAGELHQRIPGTPVPEIHNYDHLQRWPRRLAQRIVHPLLLPLFDARHPAFDRLATRPRIPEEITQALRNGNAADEAAWRTGS
jgi:Glycosyl transferase family 2